MKRATPKSKLGGGTGGGDLPASPVHKAMSMPSEAGHARSRANSQSHLTTAATTLTTAAATLTTASSTATTASVVVELSPVLSSSLLHSVGDEKDTTAMKKPGSVQSPGTIGSKKPAADCLHRRQPISRRSPMRRRCARVTPPRARERRACPCPRLSWTLRQPANRLVS